MKIFQNSLVIAFIVALTWACSSSSNQIPDQYLDPVASLYDETLKPFYHGVASGDPLPDRVIIWTRVTPTEMNTRISVEWEIAEDPDFSSIYKSDTLSATAHRDYTVKVDVDGLQPDHVYFYRFIALGKTSIIGRTKTAPVEAKDNLQFAVVSCSNWEWGYFNAYAKIADRPILDAVVHLGDYIYEYGVGKYGDTTIGRFNLPSHEIITLQDYRTRYSQYRPILGQEKCTSNTRLLLFGTIMKSPIILMREEPKIIKKMRVIMKLEKWLHDRRIMSGSRSEKTECCIVLFPLAL